MGRPVKKNQSEIQPDGTLKSQKSSAGKRFKSFKKGGGLQQSIGNASKGHGLTHKARILSRFKKRFLSKRKNTKKETLYIKPLAEDDKRELPSSHNDLSERNVSGSSSLANDETIPTKGRLTEIKKEEIFVVKPSPKKTNNSPKATLFQRKQQGPRLTSSKLASAKNSKFENNALKRNHSVNDKRLGSVDAIDNKNNTFPLKQHFKKNILGRSSEDLLKIDYQAIEEERQKEVLKIQSKRITEEYTKKLNSNIQQRKSVSKNLKQRTKRGQPVMSNQIEHILEKVKKNNVL